MRSGQIDKLRGTLPWTKSCFVCGEHNPHGLRLKSRVENGVVTLEYTTRESDLGWRSIVHGGIAMTLLDEVMTWAAIIASGKACVSAEITTRMRKPIRLNSRIRAEGTVKQQTSRILVTEAKLYINDDVMCSASGKYMPMPESDLNSCAADFVENDESIPPDLIFRP